MRFLLCLLTLLMTFSCTPSENSGEASRSWKLSEVESLRPKNRPPEFLVAKDNYSLIYFSDQHNSAEGMVFGNTYDFRFSVFGAADKCEIASAGKILYSTTWNSQTQPHEVQVTLYRDQGHFVLGSNTLEIKAYYKGEFTQRSFELFAGSQEVMTIQPGETPDFSVQWTDTPQYTLCTFQLFPQDYSEGIPMLFSPRLLPFHKYQFQGKFGNVLTFQNPPVSTQEEYQKSQPILIWTNPDKGIKTEMPVSEFFLFYSNKVKIKFFPDGSWLLQGRVPHEGHAQYLWASVTHKSLFNLNEVFVKQSSNPLEAPLIWDFKEGNLLAEEYRSPWMRNPNKTTLKLYQVNPQDFSLRTQTSRETKPKGGDELLWLKDSW